MNFKNRKLFTLVELIIVIAIIGVLSVIAFTIVTKWLGKSRDSRRLGEINQIAKGLQSYFVENGKYPTPDMNYITLTSGANTIGYQGFVGSGVSRAIELNKITKDPMDEKYYTYTTNLQKYQLLAMLEGTGSMNLGYEGKIQGERINEYVQNNLSTFSLLPFNYVYAATDYSQRYPYLVGDKLGVILANTGGNTDAPVQELYNSTTFTGINVPTINTGIYTSYVDNTTVLNGTGLLQMPIYTNESVVTPTIQESGGGGSSPVNSCASTAWLSNATYSTGTPTTTNQAWQNSNSGNPCYFSCNGGYSWDGSSCVLKITTVSSAVYNARTFSYVAFILAYGTPQTKTSNVLLIVGGNSTLTAIFTLGIDGTTVTLSSASESISCNAGYIQSGSDCIPIYTHSTIGSRFVSHGYGDYGLNCDGTSQSRFCQLVGKTYLSSTCLYGRTRVIQFDGTGSPSRLPGGSPSSDAAGDFSYTATLTCQ